MLRLLKAWTRSLGSQHDSLSCAWAVFFGRCLAFDALRETRVACLTAADLGKVLFGVSVRLAKMLVQPACLWCLHASDNGEESQTAVVCICWP